MKKLCLALSFVLSPLAQGAETVATKSKYQNYSAESKEYINPFKEQRPRNMGGFWEMMGVMKQMFIDRVSKGPTSMPQVKPDITEFLQPAPHLKFIWFGHSTLLFNLDGKTVLIDPVFSDYAFSMDLFVKRFQAPALSLEELPKIDLILISHDHYDHLDEKTMKFFVDKETRFIMPTGVGSHLVEWGISRERITELEWDQNATEFGIKITATPAQHFSGRSLFDKNKTLWASWVIQGQNDKIFYSGDSGYAEHFKEIGNTYGPFDITFIENGQYNERWLDVHMLPEETIQAHLDLKGKIFVPVHWGMFALALHPWTEPVEKTRALALEKGIPYLSPMLGQVVDISAKNETVAWWKKEQPEETPKQATQSTSPLQEKRQ